MALTFPVDCDTPRERTEYCYRAQELLRLLHNGMGRWFREGLTQNQWDKFPERIKNRFPYKPQLAKAKWDDFTNNVFEVIDSRISEKLLQNRQLLKESTQWPINIEEVLD